MWASQPASQRIPHLAESDRGAGIVAMSTDRDRKEGAREGRSLRQGRLLTLLACFPY